MPLQAPQWTEFLSCPICCSVFNETRLRPISLACGHTVCKTCLSKLQQNQCPFDQTHISRPIEDLPVNFALLQLVGAAVPDIQDNLAIDAAGIDNIEYYNTANKCIEELAILLKPMSSELNATAVVSGSILSRPMQRKLVGLVNCQLVEEEGRGRCMRAARSLGDRSVTELILLHQNPQQLSANLWAAVRARGCQFLGPAMQEEVLQLILLALEDGSALSRKVLVLFVVQRLEAQYPQASKTAIGHVVQLLYRASCFKVTKREEESSLMQLKEELRSYEALRREHDSQIVQIATEAGLRIAPEQWSSLLYGDNAHKPHMQSIIDKLQTPQSFSQSVTELVIALQRTGDPGNLSRLRPHFDLIANIDPTSEAPSPSWENLAAVLRATKTVVQGLVEFLQNRASSCMQRRQESSTLSSTKYKTSMCRDFEQKQSCPRGASCTFAHSKQEMDRYRARNKKSVVKAGTGNFTKPLTSSSLNAKEKAELDKITRSAEEKLQAGMHHGFPIILSYQQTMDGLAVNVPVMKPSVLPAPPRSQYHQSIYSSPAPVGSTDTDDLQEFHSLAGVPIPHKMPTIQPIQPPEETLKRIGIISAKAATHLPHSTDSLRGSNGYSDNIAQLSTEAMRSTVAMPANPYTSSRMTPKESVLYSPRHIGQTPTEHLGELHRRRNVLLDKLSYAGQHEMTRLTSSYSPIPTPVATDCGMEQSVADSIGASHSTLSLAKKIEITTASHASPPVVHPDQISIMSQGICETTDNDDDGSYVSWSTNSPLSNSNVQQTNRSGDEPCSFTPYCALGSRSTEQNDQDTSSQPGSIISWQDDDEEQDELTESEWPDMDMDEFVPWEHTVVSRYGPISRMAKAKMKDTGPVQVTAAQGKLTRPVTAVTPMQRPNPLPSEVPSRFSTHMPHVVGNSDHLPHPYGQYVASSLPTALMRPSLTASSNTSTQTASQTLRDKLLNIPEQENIHANNIKIVPRESSNQDQMRLELMQLNQQIQSLHLSENDRLARELSAIEMDILETERQIIEPPEAKWQDTLDIVVAQEAQLQEVSRHAEKQQQEEQDLLFAQQLALEESRHAGDKVDDLSFKE